ncbi:MAG: hypothetical protein MUC59_04085 [Saprospiraceae bacterium]|jgi:hypothetical protein|nr:hypothetical protein [Saprospiraceae bacterium]
MTKTYLLCLANSKKYGERCIAGIQLVPDAQQQFHPLKIDGKPRWLRPVSGSEHGQVPAQLVAEIAVGDIISFEVLELCPSGYQTENCLFYQSSLTKVRAATMTKPHLDQLVEHHPAGLLGNTQRSIEMEEIGAVNRSLVLVRPDEVQPYFTTPYNTKPRVKFKLDGIAYDLPMTDVNFFDRMQEGLGALAGMTPYIAVSLSMPFEGRLYKLAAGMVYC